jgi:hypothetical protein
MDARTGTQQEIIIASVDLNTMFVRFRRALRLINNDFNTNIKQSFYKSADTFVFLAFSASYSGYVRDSPSLPDYIFSKATGMLFTTDPSQFAQ